MEIKEGIQYLPEDKLYLVQWPTGVENMRLHGYEIKKVDTPTDLW